MYLQCFVDNYRDCQTKGECESTGECSDRPWLTAIVPNESDEQVLQITEGKCMTSSMYYPLDAFSSYQICVAWDLDGPHFFVRDNMMYPIACGAFPEVFIGGPNPCDPVFIWNGLQMYQQYLMPAKTESECLSETDFRYGCELPIKWERVVTVNVDDPQPTTVGRYVGAINQRQERIDPEECSCYGGEAKNRWEWKDGKWTGGEVRRAKWLEKEVKPRSVWQSDALSFFRVEKWVVDSVQELSTIPLKSDIMCSAHYISIPLLSAACDCGTSSGNGKSVKMC